MNRFATPGQRRASFIRWALVCIPAVLLLGMLSGWLSGSSGEDPWFAALHKPALYPPAATFGIAWTILYVLMGLGLALAIVGRRGIRTGATRRSSPSPCSWA